MAQRDTSDHALSTAIVVCFLLLAVSFLTFRYFPIPENMYKNALLFTIFFCTALISVIVYQSQKIYKYASRMAEDLTEDILLYSHELFSELYRSSPVPYIVIDPGGTIESANFATARLFEVEAKSLIGLNIFEYLTGDSHKIDLIPEYSKQQKSVHDVELQFKRPDGVLKWVVFSLFSFIDPNHTQKSLVTLVDITKLKQIDIAKTEFVSLASHQLRTPISGMKWNVELLLMDKKEALTEKQRKYIEKVDAALRQMNMLVEDFLSASKFELGTLTPTFTEVDIQKFLEDIYEEHHEFAERKGVHIQKELASGTIQSDTHLFHMVISNLLGNAVKYTPEGGTVTFNAVFDDAHLIITVADTGIGIPAEDQETIFSKMFRATNARNHASGGTGLGLYIAREAVTVLKGTVTFVSKESVGTTFTVTVPR